MIVEEFMYRLPLQIIHHHHHCNAWLPLWNISRPITHCSSIGAVFQSNQSSPSGGDLERGRRPGGGAGTRSNDGRRRWGSISNSKKRCWLTLVILLLMFPSFALTEVSTLSNHSAPETNYTGLEMTPLRNIFFWLFLTKTEREQVLPSPVYGKIWPHSTRFWLWFSLVFSTLNC